MLEKHICNHSIHYEKYGGAVQSNYHVKLRGQQLSGITSMVLVLILETGIKIFKSCLVNFSFYIYVSVLYMETGINKLASGII